MTYTDDWVFSHALAMHELMKVYLIHFTMPTREHILCGYTMTCLSFLIFSSKQRFELHVNTPPPICEFSQFISELKSLSTI